MLNRSLIAFIGGICMAIAYGTVQEANAESVNIIFSGTVPHTCTIASPTQSPASTGPSGLDYSTNQLHIACNDDTQVDAAYWAQEERPTDYDQAPAHLQNTSDHIADGYQTITPQ